MKLLYLAVAMSMTLGLCCTAQAYVLTFDDVPTGVDFGLYYWNTYGISLDEFSLEVVDHTLSQWGPPHSGSNVLAVAQDSNITRLDTMFKNQAVWSVYSFGAFFSTEQDAVLQIVGYDGGLDHPVSTAYIGATGQSWNNQFVQVSSPTYNICMVVIYPVSTDALHQFCLDDLTVIPVPEPSSLAALGVGLLPLVGLGLKKRLCRWFR